MTCWSLYGVTLFQCFPLERFVIQKRWIFKRCFMWYIQVLKLENVFDIPNFRVSSDETFVNRFVHRLHTTCSMTMFTVREGLDEIKWHYVADYNPKWQTGRTLHKLNHHRIECAYFLWTFTNPLSKGSATYIYIFVWLSDVCVLALASTYMFSY